MAGITFIWNWDFREKNQIAIMPWWVFLHAYKCNRICLFLFIFFLSLIFSSFLFVLIGLYHRLHSFTWDFQFKCEQKNLELDFKVLYHNWKKSTAQQFRFTWKITTIVLVVKCMKKKTVRPTKKVYRHVEKELCVERPVWERRHQCAFESLEFSFPWRFYLVD